MLQIRVLILLLLVVAVCETGCVRRRMTVYTNPTGATVYRDNVELGKSPVSVDFQHYGRQEFAAVKEGYETKRVILPVRAPWYQWIGIDFFTEVLLPGTLTDHQEFQLDMQPQRMVPPTELLARAEEVRVAAGVGTQRSPATTSTTTTPPGLVPAPIQPAIQPGSIPAIPIATPANLAR